MAERILVLKTKDPNNVANAGTNFQIDWATIDPNTFQVKNIDKIVDLSGANVKRRVTAYPTPIARMHFFDDAFQFVFNTNRLIGNTVYHEAVSHCLDIWEILFNFDVFSDRITIKE